MIDPNDDLATANAPYKVVACMAVHGRLPLVEHTIKRLYRKNDVHKVICVGEMESERRVCEDAGAEWVEYRNYPLGDKWNQAFMAAEKEKPDAVLFVGSSDFIENNWIHTMRPYVENYGFAGAKGCFFIDLRETKRLVWWPGYAESRRTRDRDDETIGIGRMLSRELMAKLNWQPFDYRLNNSLDSSMKKRAAAVGFKDVMVPGLKALSISTDQWPNKHRFEEHWSGIIPSQRIASVEPFIKQFPEIEIVDASIHQREPVRP